MAPQARAVRILVAGLAAAATQGAQKRQAVRAVVVARLEVRYQRQHRCLFFPPWLLSAVFFASADGGAAWRFLRLANRDRAGTKDDATVGGDLCRRDGREGWALALCLLPTVVILREGDSKPAKRIGSGRRFRGRRRQRFVAGSTQHSFILWCSGFWSSFSLCFSPSSFRRP